MAEMAATPEIEHVFADLAALTGMVNSGEAGLPAIQRLVELVQRAVDSAGATFIGNAEGRDIYRNFAIPTGLTEDRWVRAVEFRPGARRVVHHALFQYARGGALASLKSDGRPGFPGAMPIAAMPALMPSGHLGGWAVGATPHFLQDGLA